MKTHPSHTAVEKTEWDNSCKILRILPSTYQVLSKCQCYFVVIPYDFKISKNVEFLMEKQTSLTE